MYYADTGEESLLECKARGAFRKAGISPMVGDIVEIQISPEDGKGYIMEIMPRKNKFIRPNVSNVDLLCVVAASAYPETDLFVLDKICAVACHNKTETLLIFNKSDLKSAQSLIDVYKKSGIDCVAVSAEEMGKNSLAYQNEREYILEKLKGKTSFFTGASGVGKTSLINCLFENLCLETGSLSRKIERGKHTTRQNVLYKISRDTYIGDTPGFGILEIAQFNLIPKDGLLSAFPDIEKYSHTCRYTDCTHTKEEECGVAQALKDGLISSTRHESFARLYEELKQTNHWDNKQK